VAYSIRVANAEVGPVNFYVADIALMRSANMGELELSVKTKIQHSILLTSRTPVDISSVVGGKSTIAGLIRTTS